MSFFDQLATAIEKKKTRLCVGIDPDLNGEHWRWSKEDRCTKLNLFCDVLICQAAQNCSAIKLQSAHFEALGFEGVQILTEKVKAAKELGLLVILDAKRGDVPSTLELYGRSAFDVIGADCLTVQPYLGAQALSALAPWLELGKGIYVVWTTSNPGASAIQECETKDGKVLLDAVFADVAGADWYRSESVGWVVGATRLSDGVPWRDTSLVGANVLMPGFGAQGATPSGSIDGLLRECKTTLVPVSRGLIQHHAKLTSWSQFEETVHDNMKAYAKQFSVA